MDFKGQKLQIVNQLKLIYLIEVGLICKTMNAKVIRYFYWLKTY